VSRSFGSVDARVSAVTGAGNIYIRAAAPRDWVRDYQITGRESIWTSGFERKNPGKPGRSARLSHFSVYSVADWPHAAVHKLMVASRERLFPVRSLHLRPFAL
jgi:hypothetical protein